MICSSIAMPSSANMQSVFGSAFKGMSFRILSNVSLLAAIVYSPLLSTNVGFQESSGVTYFF